MDGNKDILASLKTMKNKVATAWKLDEGVGLLKKVEEENEAVQAKARRLVEEKEVMEANKKQAEKKAARLR